MVYEAKHHEFRSAPINMENKYVAANSDVGLVRRFSGMQWQKLLNQLGNSETIYAKSLMGKSVTNSWIIDTGASIHVIGDISILTYIIDLPRCPIGLSDGNLDYATKSGRVQLFSEFILYDVLYVPQFTCNLIFVTKLSDNMNCVIQFTKDACLIRDPTLRTLIGIGERMDVLYYFCSIPKALMFHVDGKLFLLIDKTEVLKYFMQFCALIDRQFDAKVRFVRSDNETEFPCL
ncbi:hypothetical protein LIER_26359 [Lithospermum erythrorhizon]|uniref:Retrovirus-related Pol polyprotein from transposon TNT 1-94-like beta-barrel domain-containing protein n=1 Tax=Lithospermum erythrorhizon TaxID=34254 RepID=A0AAV3R9K0_LITER